MEKLVCTPWRQPLLFVDYKGRRRYCASLLSRTRSRAQHYNGVTCLSAVADLANVTLPGAWQSIARHSLLLADNGFFTNSFVGGSGDLEALVQSQLTGLSPLTFAVVFVAGLLTSLSPCTLSVLPLTIGYIGGYSTEGSSTGLDLTSRAVAFSLGLATTLAALGIVSTYVGKAYGQIGSGLPIAVSLIAIVMGLNLLEAVQLPLPSLDVDVRNLSMSPLATAYLAGLTFALAASPCSTPVLATLLAYVASTKDPISGGVLLLSYTSGYVVPLLVAATMTGAMKQVLELRQWSAWVPQASGFLLLSGGVYGLLSRLLPA